ncbi:hypothetical protein Gotur_019020 [Gossypium turneri]
MALMSDEAMHRFEVPLGD